MDGDARRPAVPQAKSDYQVHVDYELPPGGLESHPAKKPDAPDEKSGDANGESSQKDQGDDAKKKAPMPRWKKLLYWAVGLAVLLLLIVAAVLYWLHARHFASTDDAFIDAHISQIAARVPGRVSRVAVDDYQHVKAGEVLVEIDPRDYQVKLDQADAELTRARAQVRQAQASLGNQQAAVDQARAQLRSAQADLSKAQSDNNRYRSVNPAAVSRQSVDAASATLKSAQARVDEAQQSVAAAEANVSVQAAQIEGAKANAKTAEVGVENAKLQLSYTTVLAPRDGQVAKRTVELGNYINPGQALLAVVGDERWVTANFKETQLADMRPGQDVTIEVDACPSHEIHGKVLALQPGSGSAFSVLPAENATGNYVKVVQRVPVKIVIEHEDAVRCLLAPGMSVVPSVTVR